MIVIPEAFLVEENAPMEVPYAEVAELMERNQTSSPPRTRRSCLVLFNAGFILAVGTALFSIIFTRGSAPVILQTSEPKETKNQALVPSPQPTRVQPFSEQLQSVRSLIEKNVLERNASFDGNRLLALDWILTEDERQLGAEDSNLYQRYILALLSYEFSISGVSNADGFGWLSEGHECEWRGVACNNDSYVTEVDLCEFLREMIGK
jgi:hypothetical protein